jgi:hypothetical protein
VDVFISYAFIVFFLAIYYKYLSISPMVITNCWKAGDLMRVLQSATLPMSTDMNVDNLYYTGADPAGCALPRIGENMIFWHKIVDDVAWYLFNGI